MSRVPCSISDCRGDSLRGILCRSSTKVVYYYIGDADESYRPFVKIIYMAEEKSTSTHPKARRVPLSVASFRYSYDPPWGLFDVASSAKALADNGSVVAEARVTTPFASAGAIGSLDVEEVIYRGDGTNEVVGTGSIRFDAQGRGSDIAQLAG
jgi:hypothetical protein